MLSPLGRMSAEMPNRVGALRRSQKILRWPRTSICCLVRERTAGVLEGRIHLGASAHQDLLEALWPALQVVRPAQARIGDGAGGRAGHALAKAFQWWAIEGCLGGVADAVRGGDHPSLPVAGHLR